jgi:hypothetical protein
MGVAPIDLAFVIQDPCGEAALNLAVAVLELVRGREDDIQCRALMIEVRCLANKYPRK